MLVYPSFMLSASIFHASLLAADTVDSPIGMWREMCSRRNLMALTWLARVAGTRYRDEKHGTEYPATIT